MTPLSLDTDRQQILSLILWPMTGLSCASSRGGWLQGCLGGEESSQGLTDSHIYSSIHSLADTLSDSSAHEPNNVITHLLLALTFTHTHQPTHSLNNSPGSLLHFLGAQVMSAKNAGRGGLQKQVYDSSTHNR